MNEQDKYVQGKIDAIHDQMEILAGANLWEEEPPMDFDHEFIIECLVKIRDAYKMSFSSKYQIRLDNEENSP